MVGDLENDYINPIEMADKLNIFWFPNIIVYTIFLCSIILLISVFLVVFPNSHY
jgi:hypothetical protein